MKIIQIAPVTTKIYAVYKDKGDNGETVYEKVPIHLWALMEDGDGVRYIDGVDIEDAQLGFAETRKHFMGFTETTRKHFSHYTEDTDRGDNNG